ncbi:hypothetical protein B296_00010097 [Ensete ventricosum]|uniref:Uncharacterized protein n=1 Tax=Ensete ventricosum TaxID=4639 RepID=A0A427ALQ1_ENSVE|nr:hypothetical protein B296_00010097 [Ensete ventricosum]
MGSSVSHASLPSRQSLPRCRSLRSRTRSRGLVESFKPRSLRADTTRGARFVYVSSTMHLQERWLNSSIIGSKCRTGQGKDAYSGADRSLFLVFVSRAPCKLQRELQSDLILKLAEKTVGSEASNIISPEDGMEIYLAAAGSRGRLSIPCPRAPHFIAAKLMLKNQVTTTAIVTVEDPKMDGQDCSLRRRTAEISAPHMPNTGTEATINSLCRLRSSLPFSLFLVSVLVKAGLLRGNPRVPSQSCVEAALVEELKSVGVDGKQKGAIFHPPFA